MSCSFFTVIVKSIHVFTRCNAGTITAIGFACFDLFLTRKLSVAPEGLDGLTRPFFIVTKVQRHSE